MKTLAGYWIRATRSSNNWYVWLAAGVLGVSTTVWSFMIARLQQGNADQLADGFLFEHLNTFRQAQFPVSHALLLKWPLFWLLAVFHNARWIYFVSTVSLCLVTVGSFAYLLFRISRRPEVRAALYLGLACVLALVPVQVLGGVSSPLSMAMITGRNIEYPLYIAVLVLVLQVGQRYSWRQWGFAVALLGLLLASDHLFLVCSFGGALGLLVVSYGWHNRALMKTAQRWLLGSGAAWAVSWILVWVFRQATHIIGASTGPYGHATDAASVHGATAYGLKGLALNFGISLGTGWLSFVPALLNMALLVLAIYAGYVVFQRSARQSQLDRPTTLSIGLNMSVLALFVMYVATNHPVAADARYLSLVLFAGFVALATYSRMVQVSLLFLRVLRVTLTLGVVLGTISVVGRTNHTLRHDLLSRRNERVVQVLADHHAQLLVGDYWRVLPIKERTKDSAQRIVPLSSCLQPRQVLTSTAWEQDLYTHSFAYVLSLQPLGTPFGRCSLQTIVFVYGRPSSIERIAGSSQNPAELLLFYNNGAAKLRGKSTLPPTPVFGVPTEGTARPTGSTITPLASPS